MNLSLEEEKLYNEIKGVYNEVTNAGHQYSVAYLSSVVAHYNSWRGWVGRNSYWLYPLAVVVSYEIGKYVGRH